MSFPPCNPHYTIRNGKSNTIFEIECFKEYECNETLSSYQIDACYCAVLLQSLRYFSSSLIIPGVKKIMTLKEQTNQILESVNKSKVDLPGRSTMSIHRSPNSHIFHCVYQQKIYKKRKGKTVRALNNHHFFLVIHIRTSLNTPFKCSEVLVRNKNKIGITHVTAVKYLLNPL